LVPDWVSDDDLGSLAVADASNTVVIDPYLAPPPTWAAVVNDFATAQSPTNAARQVAGVGWANAGTVAHGD
jgi:hypothetical protein